MDITDMLEVYYGVITTAMLTDCVFRRMFQPKYAKRNNLLVQEFSSELCPRITVVGETHIPTYGEHEYLNRQVNAHDLLLIRGTKSDSAINLKFMGIFSLIAPAWIPYALGSQRFPRISTANKAKARHLETVEELNGGGESSELYAYVAAGVIGAVVPTAFYVAGIRGARKELQLTVEDLLEKSQNDALKHPDIVERNKNMVERSVHYLQEERPTSALVFVGEGQFTDYVKQLNHQLHMKEITKPYKPE